jgi:hypothetical protein
MLIGSEIRASGLVICRVDCFCAAADRDRLPSRWGASKRRSPYTQMFLTHIDENGHNSPAILIEKVW